jgi:hypothetical protein
MNLKKLDVPVENSITKREELLSMKVFAIIAPA